MCRQLLEQYFSNPGLIFAGSNVRKCRGDLLGDEWPFVSKPSWFLQKLGVTWLMIGLLCHRGVVSCQGPGSSTSPQGVRLSPRLQYIALWRLFIERKVGHIIVGSTDAFTNEYPALPSWESQHMNLLTIHIRRMCPTGHFGSLWDGELVAGVRWATNVRMTSFWHQVKQ